MAREEVVTHDFAEPETSIDRLAERARLEVRQLGPEREAPAHRMSGYRCAVAATTVLGRCRDIEDANVIIDDNARRRRHVATIDSAEEQLVSVQARDLEHVKRR